MLFLIRKLGKLSLKAVLTVSLLNGHATPACF